MQLVSAVLAAAEARDMLQTEVMPLSGFRCLPDDLKPE